MQCGGNEISKYFLTTQRQKKKKEGGDMMHFPLPYPSAILFIGCSGTLLLWPEEAGVQSFPELSGK